MKTKAYQDSDARKYLEDLKEIVAIPFDELKGSVCIKGKGMVANAKTRSDFDNLEGISLHTADATEVSKIAERFSPQDYAFEGTGAFGGLVCITGHLSEYTQKLKN